MIAFACSITESEPYARYAEPGIRLAAETDSAILPFAAVGNMSRCHNVLVDAAARRSDLEALVIVHPHTEIADPEFCRKVRQALSDSEVAVVGCVGAKGVRSLAWWEGAVSCGSVVHRYSEHGGGEIAAFSWADPAPAPAEVDAVDGWLLVLSPWAVRNLRFDEALALGHGFEVDYCWQALTAGHKVVTADLRVIQHRGLDIVPDLSIWVEAHMALSRKWLGRVPSDGDGRGWQERARWAEAQREAARAIAYSKKLMIDARVDALERELKAHTDSASWRLTAPLRRLNFRRRQLTAGRKPVPPASPYRAAQGASPTRRT